MASSFFKNNTIHPDWQGFLTKEVLNLIAETEAKIFGSDFTPSSEKVLRFLQVPLSPVKIIILGQDPYPQPGVATGRAFEVGNLRSWAEPFQNISLKNILRAIYKAYTGEIIKYSDLKAKFDNEFPVLPPCRLFTSWETQGVLLLNSSFTCVVGKPGSHREIWHLFSTELFRWISLNHPGFTWFLWGADAATATQGLGLRNTVVTKHPMMCFEGNNRDDDFLFGKINGFESFRDKVDWTGFPTAGKIQRSQTLF